MRDNAVGMPEIVDAYERDGFFFGVVRVSFNGEPIAFEFGVDRSGFTTLRRILETHPLAKMPGVKHRYYFTGNFSSKTPRNTSLFTVRVEADRDSNQFETEGPISLVSNLLWFLRLKSADEASNLQRVS